MSKPAKTTQSGLSRSRGAGSRDRRLWHIGLCSSSTIARPCHSVAPRTRASLFDPPTTLNILCKPIKCAFICHLQVINYIEARQRYTRAENLVSPRDPVGPPNCEPYSRSGASGAPSLLHSYGGSPNLAGLGLDGQHDAQAHGG